MRLGMQAAVGIQGQFAVQRKSVPLGVFTHLAPLAQAERFHLEQDDIGKAVVDFGKVEVFEIDLGHLQGIWRGKAEPDRKRVGPGGNIIRRVGVALGNPRNIHRVMFEVARPFRRGHDHGCGSVGFQTTVEQPEGFGDPAGVQIVLHAERTTLHIGFIVQLGMFA